MKEYLKKISQSSSMTLYLRLLQMVTKGKRYLSPDLTAVQVTQELECTPRQLAAAVQVGGEENFSTFINRLRVKEACRRLSLTRYYDQKMEEIAKGCGFMSRQVFYRSFEKEMGETPAHWRAQHCEKPAPKPKRRKKTRTKKRKKARTTKAKVIKSKVKTGG